MLVPRRRLRGFPARPRRRPPAVEGRPRPRRRPSPKAPARPRRRPPVPDGARPAPKAAPAPEGFPAPEGARPLAEGAPDWAISGPEPADGVVRFLPIPSTPAADPPTHRRDEPTTAEEDEPNR